jgi:CoA-transferase family III
MQPTSRRATIWLSSIESKRPFPRRECSIWHQCFFLHGPSVAPNGALTGIRVVDLTRVLAGPLCTMMLGDMGADVIKIEPPESGDDTRSWGPPFVAGESAYFLGINRNKRSLTLNLASDDGRSILASLITKADVVINNYKLGTFEKWGFDDAWFDANASRAVRCSITGYGSSGPKAALPGYDFILQAEKVDTTDLHRKSESAAADLRCAICSAAHRTAAKFACVYRKAHPVIKSALTPCCR